MIKLHYYSATWCGPCKMFKPIVQKFADKHPECEVVYMDIEEHPEQAETFNIRAVPTCVFMKGEKEVSRFSGSKSLDHLESLLDEATI